MKWLAIVASLLVSQAVRAGPLRVALQDSAPFAWKEGAGFKGFHYEIVENIGRKMGVTIEPRLVPLMRAIDLLRKGSVDFLIMTDRPALQEMHTEKVLLLNVEIFFYTQVDKPVRSKGQIKGAIARLVMGCNELQGRKEIKWFDTESYEQAFDLLKAGRVNGVCGTIAFLPAVERSGGSRSGIHALRIGSRAVWLHALPNVNRETRMKVQKAVAALRQEGIIDRLAQKYEKPIPR